MSCKKNVATKEKHYSKVIVTRSFPVCKAFVSVCQYLSYSSEQSAVLMYKFPCNFSTSRFSHSIIGKKVLRLLIDSVSKILTL